MSKLKCRVSVDGKNIPLEDIDPIINNAINDIIYGLGISRFEPSFTIKIEVDKLKEK